MKLERGKDLLYLSQQQIVDLNITMKQMIDLMEKMYTEKSKGNTQMPSKIALHTVKEFPGDFVHTMPAYISSMNCAGGKIVSGYEIARN